MPEELFSTTFRNTRTNEVVTVQLFNPKPEANPNGGTDWKCNYCIEQNGKVTDKHNYGCDWMQALLIAHEGATLEIVKNETEWETTDGLPAWIVIPKLIPISWKYDFYKKC